jgi:hypothetical protein
VVKVGDEARYASAVDALLHYSDKVAQVRMYSFVQSVAVLGALFFLASEWGQLVRRHLVHWGSHRAGWCGDYERPWPQLLPSSLSDTQIGVEHGAPDGTGGRQSRDFSVDAIQCTKKRSQPVQRVGLPPCNLPFVLFGVRIGCPFWSGSSFSILGPSAERNEALKTNICHLLPPPVIHDNVLYHG